MLLILFGPSCECWFYSEKLSMWINSAGNDNWGKEPPGVFCIVGCYNLTLFSHNLHRAEYCVACEQGDNC